MKLFEDSLPPSEDDDQWDDFYSKRMYTQGLMEEIMINNDLVGDDIYEIYGI